MSARSRKRGADRSRERRRGEEGGQARLAVNLPVSTHRQLKARAAAEGDTIRDYILAMLKRNGIG